MNRFSILCLCLFAFGCSSDQQIKQQQFVDQVNATIVEINKDISLLNYESAMNKTNQLLSTVYNDSICDVETYNVLNSKVKSLYEKISADKNDFDNKIKNGWKVINNKLLSIEEQQKLQKLELERQEIERQKKIGQEKAEQEKAEQIRRQIEEQARINNAKIEAEKAQQSAAYARKRYPDYKKNFEKASDALLRIIKAIEVGTHYTDYVRMMQFLNYEVSKFKDSCNDIEKQYLSYYYIDLALSDLLIAEREWSDQIKVQNDIITNDIKDSSENILSALSKDHENITIRKNLFKIPPEVGDILILSTSGKEPQMLAIIEISEHNSHYILLLSDKIEISWRDEHYSIEIVRLFDKRREIYWQQAKTFYESAISALNSGN